MVEFLKTKPTSYINKPRGLINVDTGATQVGNAIAKLGSEIQERGFRDAVVEQEKLGQNTALNIQVVDDNNELVMAQLPTNLSKVAMNVAEPILRKKMANAIYIDTQAGLSDIRKTAKNEAEFKQKAEVYLDQVSMRMAETGGESYITEFKDTFSQVYAQHGNALKIQDGLKENEYHLTKHTLVIEDQIAQLKMAYQKGNPLSDALYQELLAKINSTPDEFMNVKASGVAKLKDDLNLARSYGLISKSIPNASSNDIVNIQSAIRDGGASLKNVPEKYKDAVNQIIDITDPSLREDLITKLNTDYSSQAKKEQDARLEFNKGKQLRVFDLAQKQIEFNNDLVTKISGATTEEDFKNITNNIVQRLKESRSEVSSTSSEAVLNNQKSMYAAFATGIQKHIARILPDATSADYEAVRIAIATNGEQLSGLKPELLAPIKSLLKNTPDTFVNQLAQSFAQVHALVKQSEVATNAQRELENTITDIENGTAPKTKKVTNIVEELILNGKDKTYFTKPQSLGDPEIEKNIIKGYMPPTILSEFQLLASGSLSDERQAVALNRYARFSRYLNPATNNIQNKLTVPGGLGAETNALLMASLRISQTQGVEDFNQLISKLRMAKEEPQRVASVVQNVLGAKSVNQYLNGSTFTEAKVPAGDFNILRDMKPYVEYLALSGMDKSTIDQHVTDFIKEKYLPTNGIVADPQGPVGRSMYSLEAILPDQDMVNKFVNLVNEQLPDGYSLNESLQTSSSNFFDRFAEENKFNPIMKNVGEGLSAITNIGGQSNKKVYLVPHPISPTNIDSGYGGEVVYYAMSLDDTGELKPVIGKNSSGVDTMFAWSTKEVTQQVITKQIQSDKIDTYTLENEDILSEDIAQSNIDAETIKNKTIAEVGGKAILPMGAF
jgi:hypothetical protein